MSAPEGNQFWKLRSKHGRDKIFETPAILWEACEEYFEKTESRKWIRKDWVGKDAMEVKRETETPFTLTGLFVFLEIDRKTWDLYRLREEFIPVTTRVEQIMYTQKFEGASVGAFNANIIARDLGLREQTDVNVSDSRKSAEELFPSEEEFTKETES